MRERITVNREPISREAVVGWTAELLDSIEQQTASFFEACTAIAFADFAARSVDVAVVEVGLGGRLDSTNVLSPEVSAITQVNRDHTDYLGDTLREIAHEKAHIAKSGTPLVVGERDPELLDEIIAVASGLGARVSVVPEERLYDGELRLRGCHQRRNAAVAERILGCMPQPLEAGDVAAGFARADAPGRFDVRGKWIFDVAHNQSGIEVLVDVIREHPPRRPLHALVSILKDKDWLNMLGTLSAHVDCIYLTNAPTAPRERQTEYDINELQLPCTVIHEPQFDTALRDVCEGAGTVLVTGSTYVVGDAMSRLPGFAPLG